MSLGRAVHQKPGSPGRNAGGRGEADPEVVRDEARTARDEAGSPWRDGLLAQALARANMEAAWKRVKSKSRQCWGGWGVDCRDGGLPENALAPDSGIFAGWQLPAPAGAPGPDPEARWRRAHDAVLDAQRYVQDGYRVVVDVDLEKFFDRVNHDILMERLPSRIDDKAVLRLIRRYLVAGIMDGEVVMARYKGTPQGGPLSPLLANVLLDEVDRELERRGYRFVRYADDCNVYVRSPRAGELVLACLTKLYGRLRLKANDAKTAVAPASRRNFLGYAFLCGRGGQVKCRVADKALKTFKQRIRQLTRRSGVGFKTEAVTSCGNSDFADCSSLCCGQPSVDSCLEDIDGIFSRPAERAANVKMVIVDLRLNRFAGKLIGN